MNLLIFKQFALQVFTFSLFVIIISGCASSNKSQSKTDNYVYEYENNSPIIIQHTASTTTNKNTVYLSVNVRRLRLEGSNDAFNKNLRLSYRLKSIYTGADVVKVDSIPSGDLTVKKTGPLFFVTINVPKTTTPTPFLFVDVEDIKTGFRVTEDVLLESEGKSNFSNRILYNISDSLPSFNQYVVAGSPVKIMEESTRPLVVSYIKDEFPPAPAPMSTSAKNVKKDIGIDSVFTINSNSEIVLSNTGLYLIQEDTSKSDGLGFRVEPKNYPKYSKVEHLIKPLLYISTTEELKNLNKAEDKKKALDNYWLKVGGNANDAKRLIKIFYDRVEAANEKFSSYKEGWKTDMGMIYIIFGEPSQVLRNGEQEQWLYEKTEGMSEVKFTFVKVRNIYSNNHYELIRYPEYEEYWYNKVDLWRKGIPGI